MKLIQKLVNCQTDTTHHAVKTNDRGKHTVINMGDDRHIPNVVLVVHDSSELISRELHLHPPKKTIQLCIPTETSTFTGFFFSRKTNN